MITHRLSFADSAIIYTEPYSDHRGLFTRFFCVDELSEFIGNRSIINVNFSRSVKSGCVRGMHFQRPPHEEIKFVRCIRGKIFDVIVDIRRKSPTYLKWCSEELSADNMKMIVVPEGFAHGFQVLEDNSELLYLHTSHYHPESEGGILYSDPALNIHWPNEITDVSDRDRLYPVIDENFQGFLL